MSAKTEEERWREGGRERESFEGQMMRMTASAWREGGRNGGRGNKGRGKKKLLTEATWQDHTAIFHSHSSAFAQECERFPSPEEASQRAAPRQFLKPVTPPFLFLFLRCIGSCGTEAPPPSGCCHCSRCHAKHVRRQARARTHAHAERDAFTSHCKTTNAFLSPSLSLFFFLILHTFDSSEYSCGIFYRVLSV